MTSVIYKQPAAIIAVTGLPCTGKSTLAAHLQQHFMWPLFAKDVIKETLFDTLGWSDRAWSRRLSDVSYELLFKLLAQAVCSRTSVIVEANFRREHAQRFASLRDIGAVRLVQIVCTTDGALLQRRFIERARNGDRHPGHLDELAYTELAPQLAIGSDQVTLGDTKMVIEWDTTQVNADVAPLIEKLRIPLSGCY